jgi:hypothetical protein
MGVGGGSDEVENKSWLAQRSGVWMVRLSTRALGLFLGRDEHPPD